LRFFTFAVRAFVRGSTWIPALHLPTVTIPFTHRVITLVLRLTFTLPSSAPLLPVLPVPSPRTAQLVCCTRTRLRAPRFTRLIQFTHYSLPTGLLRLVRCIRLHAFLPFPHTRSAVPVAHVLPVLPGSWILLRSQVTRFPLQFTPHTHTGFAVRAIYLRVRLPVAWFLHTRTAYAARFVPYIQLYRYHGSTVLRAFTAALPTHTFFPIHTVHVPVGCLPVRFPPRFPLPRFGSPARNYTALPFYLPLVSFWLFFLTRCFAVFPHTAGCGSSGYGCYLVQVYWLYCAHRTSIALFSLPLPTRWFPRLLHFPPYRPAHGCLLHTLHRTTPPRGSRAATPLRLQLRLLPDAGLRVTGYPVLHGSLYHGLLVTAFCLPAHVYTTRSRWVHAFYAVHLPVCHAIGCRAFRVTHTVLCHCVPFSTRMLSGLLDAAQFSTYYLALPWVHGNGRCITRLRCCCSRLRYARSRYVARYYVVKGALLLRLLQLPVCVYPVPCRLRLRYVALLLYVTFCVHRCCSHRCRYQPLRYLPFIHVCSAVPLCHTHCCPFVVTHILLHCFVGLPAIGLFDFSCCYLFLFFLHSLHYTTLPCCHLYLFYHTYVPMHIGSGSVTVAVTLYAHLPARCSSPFTFCRLLRTAVLYVAGWLPHLRLPADYAPARLRLRFITVTG